MFPVSVVHQRIKRDTQCCNDDFRTVVGCCDTLVTEHAGILYVCKSRVDLSVKAALLDPQTCWYHHKESQAHCGVYLWVCGHCDEDVSLSEEAGFNLPGIRHWFWRKGAQRWRGVVFKGDKKRTRKRSICANGASKKLETNCEPRGRSELIRLVNFTLSLAILTTDIVFTSPKAQKEFPKWDECPASPAERGGWSKKKAGHRDNPLCLVSYTRFSTPF